MVDTVQMSMIKNEKGNHYTFMLEIVCTLTYLYCNLQKTWYIKYKQFHYENIIKYIFTLSCFNFKLLLSFMALTKVKQP